MKGVQFGRRMLRSREFRARRFGKLRDLRCRQDIRHIHHWRMQCHVSHRKNTGRLRGSHRFAAVMTLVRWVTGHGAAALHALLIHRHGRHAVGELQKQDRDHRQHDECVFPNHLLDSKVIRRLESRNRMRGYSNSYNGRTGSNRFNVLI
jgi:hypothetical protein